MKQKWFFWGALFCAGFAVPAVALSAPMSLRQAEQIALAENLELEVTILQYQATDSAARKEYGLYDPRLKLTGNVGEARDDQNTSPVTTSESRYGRLDLSLGQKLSSGADLTLAFNNGREDNLNTSTATYDPNWRSELRLSLVQPLLSGFGRTVTEEQILVANRNREAAEAGLEQRTVTILGSVRNQYGEVRRTRDVVAYREASVALASRILEENKARVAAGVLPPLDTFEAEVGLKQRELDLLDARQNYLNQLDLLYALLKRWEPVEVTDELSTTESFTLDEETDVASALEKRPDLQQARKELERQEIQLQVSENRRLPGLDFSASYARKGLAGSYADDIDQTTTGNLDNWEIGLTLTYPIGNRQARYEALRQKYLTDAARSELERLSELVRREVRAAIRQVQVGLSRLEVTEKKQSFADEKLKILLKRREVGLATTRDVLQGEEDLASARTDFYGAQADYARAVTEYLRFTGRLLEHEGVRMVKSDDAEQLIEFRFGES